MFTSAKVYIYKFPAECSDFRRECKIHWGSWKFRWLGRESECECEPLFHGGIVCPSPWYFSFHLAIPCPWTPQPLKYGKWSIDDDDDNNDIFAVEFLVIIIATGMLRLKKNYIACYTESVLWEYFKILPRYILMSYTNLIFICTLFWGKPYQLVCWQWTTGQGKPSIEDKQE